MINIRLVAGMAGILLEGETSGIHWGLRGTCDKALKRLQAGHQLCGKARGSERIIRRRIVFLRLCYPLWALTQYIYLYLVCCVDSQSPHAIILFNSLFTTTKTRKLPVMEFLLAEIWIWLSLSLFPSVERVKWPKLAVQDQLS